MVTGLALIGALVVLFLLGTGLQAYIERQTTNIYKNRKEDIDG